MLIIEFYINLGLFPNIGKTRWLVDRGIEMSEKFELMTKGYQKVSDPIYASIKSKLSITILLN